LFGILLGCGDKHPGSAGTEFVSNVVPGLQADVVASLAGMSLPRFIRHAYDVQRLQVHGCGAVDVSIDGGEWNKGVASSEVSSLSYQYPAHHVLRGRLDPHTPNYDAKQCEVSLVCTTVYTRLYKAQEILRLSDPSSLIWALQLPVGVLLVLASSALTSSVYVRVMAGGASGALAMFFIIAVVLYRLAPSSVRSLGKGLWFIGGVSLNVVLFLFHPVKQFLMELFVDYREPPPHLTLAGWLLIATLVFSAVLGATLVKRYTEDVTVQEGMAWMVRFLGFGLILTGIQNAYIGTTLVALLALPHVAPRWLWYPVYGVCFGPVILLWWGFKALLFRFVGWQVKNPDEIFYTGGWLPEGAAALPAPQRRRGRGYLTEAQAKRQAEEFTQLEVNKLLDAVAQGKVEVGGGEIQNGRLARTPTKRRDDVQMLTPVAQQRISRLVGDRSTPGGGRILSDDDL